MKAILSIVVFLGALSTQAHDERKCVSFTETKKIILNKVFEEDGEVLCRFERMGSSRGRLEVNCQKIVDVCGGELGAGAEIWAKITTGPHPGCKLVCGCWGYKSVHLLGPETCRKKVDLPNPPYCEDYLPGPAPANCVNGPNWPGNHGKPR